MNTHQVKTEAVKVIFRCPVGQGVDHVFLIHRTVTGGFIAAAGTVIITALGILTVVITRYGEIEPVIFAGTAVAGMVIYHVHNNADTFFVECLHHLLEFVDSHLAVIGVSGVGAFGGIIVHRVIAPVELVCAEFGFIDTGIVINGQEVNVGNA